MEKKQSSIEFYRTELSALLSMKKSKFQTEIEIFEQAKAIHKDEIVESYREGRSDQQSQEAFYHRNAESYYNEIFGGEQC